MEALNEVLTNRTYLERVKKLRQMYLDQPANALDTVKQHLALIVNTEKRMTAAVRARLVKRRGEELSSFPYFCLDLGLFLLFLVWIFA